MQMNGRLAGRVLDFGRLARPSIITGPTYNPRARALFERFSIQPDETRKELYSQRFDAGEALSAWSKLDAIWVHSAHGAEAARLNWLGDIFNCTPINNPVFTPNRGYMGDGSSSYLDTGLNPGTASGIKFTQDSACLGVRSNTDNANVGSLAGFYLANYGGTTINPRITTAANQAQYRATTGTAGATSPSNTSPSAIGMFVTNRRSAGAMQGYRQGALLRTETLPSVAPPDGNLRLGSINDTSFRACQFSMGFAGGGLTDQEVLDIYNWFEPWRISVGVT